MSAENWAEVRALFDATVDLPADAREDYLARHTVDLHLRQEVRSLLAADAAAEALETPIVRVLLPSLPAGDDGGLAGADLLDAPAGGHIGPYRIVRVIGRGGMGIVYLGERADDAYRRQVAIKVVRPGFVAGDVAARFAHERRTLAALTHPNIARLYDGGSTEQGDSYFVMEFVDGAPVDRYCDERCLTIDQRLDLFRAICGGVQYAHEHLVVHRDIKPDNILVERDGTPKLLDFGVARLVSHESDHEDHEAAFAATWWMTPDYASPEQISGRARVTTASDVYSLGVLLHVLLTGLRPFDLRGPSAAAIREQLAGATLTPPSVRVAEASEQARERAVRRQTTPSRLAARLAGDLDAIVARALAPDLASRYSTVEQLARELDRHRGHYPVAARGHEFGYLARTFMRRHVMAIALSAGMALLLAAGVGAVVWQAAIAAEARSRAERRFEDVRRLALTFMFDVHDAIVNVPGTTDARVLMVRTAVTYLDNLAREAAGDRRLQRELAGAFVKVGDAQGHPTSPNVGDTAGALRSYRRAIDIADALRAASRDDVDAARTLAMAHRRLADVLAWSGEIERALTHCETSAALFRDVAAHGAPTIEDRLQVSVAQIKLGDLLGNPNLPNLARRAEAGPRYDAALAGLRQLDAAAPDDPRVRRFLGITLERIGTMHEQANAWPAATIAYRESFDIRQALAAAQPFHVDIQRDAAIAYEKLGNVERSAGKLAQAAASYRGALERFERLAKADPRSVSAARTVAVSRETLGQTLAEAGRTTEAARELRLALSGHQGLAAGDPDNAQARCDCVRVAELLGDALAHAASAADGPACQAWRESLTAADALSPANRQSCPPAAERDRLLAKLRRCS